ncbi:cupin domain-containing protein [Chloroflexota bacterium]
MLEVIMNEKDVEWIKSPALHGVTIKMLALDKEFNAHAFLSRWDPGAVFPPHAHPVLEQQYSLEGECEYQGKVYGPGSHFIFPAGYEHGPFKTGDKGRLALHVWPGLSGLEERVPELKEYLKSIGAL